MKLNNDLIIICTTVLMSIHMIMKGLLNITMAKSSGQVMNGNFDKILKNLDKFKGDE